MGETSLGGLSDGFAFFKRFQILVKIKMVVERVLDCVPVIKAMAVPQV